MRSLAVAQFSLRQDLAVAKTPAASPTPLPSAYPSGTSNVPAGLNPANFGLGGSPARSTAGGSRQVGQLGPKPTSAGGAGATSSTTGSAASRVLQQVNGSVTYFGTNVDLLSLYPDAPLGGKLDDVLHFAWAHVLPVFNFVYLPMELGLVVFCGMEITFGVIPLAFVYVDASFRESGLGFQDFFVYQWLLNMPTQMSPLTMWGGTDGLSLISEPGTLWLPFIPPAPVW